MVIDSLKILDGQLPPRALKLVTEWAISRHNLQPLANYRLRVQFVDGTTGEIDLSDRLTGPMFEVLRDPKLFAQVSIDEFGAVCWPNGADLAPDALYQRLKDTVKTPT